MWSYYSTTKIYWTACDFKNNWKQLNLIKSNHSHFSALVATSCTISDVVRGYAESSVEWKAEPCCCRPGPLCCQCRSPCLRSAALLEPHCRDRQTSDWANSDNTSHLLCCVHFKFWDEICKIRRPASKSLSSTIWWLHWYKTMGEKGSNQVHWITNSQVGDGRFVWLNHAGTYQHMRFNQTVLILVQRGKQNWLI